MKFGCRCHVVGLIAALLFFSLSNFAAQYKPIRLRNQPNAQPVGKTNAPTALARESGLFLVQFHGPPSAETRAKLIAAGIDLLHYIPEDTFLVRARGQRIEAMRALPSVQWVGEYRPEHKLHKALRGSATNARPGDLLAITVLLGPHASGAEIAEVRNALANVLQESTLRSGTVLRGKVPAARLDALSKSDAVLWLEPARPMKLFDEIASKIVAGDGGSRTLLTQTLGYDGRGVAVAVADSGLDNGDASSMHPDLFGRTPAFFYYGNLSDAADEHSHGTHVSGIIAGNGATGEVDDNDALYGLGVAPGASIIAQRIFDADGGYEVPPSFERLTRDATRAGADIGSNSWGDDTQGAYDVSAMEFDELVRDADFLTLGDQPYILEFSAGNAGPSDHSIGSPAVAKNVIATGASENDRLDFIIYADGPEAMADFSSRGPCEDGRIKPDLVAPGTWISSLQSASATDQYAWAPIDDLYQYQGGTSQAGPHASGAAAVFVQYYRQTHTNATPSPALVKAALINSATDMDDSFGTDPVPNMSEGWGRLDLTPLFDSALGFEFIDQTVLLTNNQVFEHQLAVASSDEPLKITLVYTDLPGFPGAVPALVNDLDLEVVGPDGTTYRGNQFNNGESVRDGSAADRLNNVEAVHLASPQPGQYTIRVRAFRIVEDARQDTPVVDQDFALVTSGVLAAAGTGIIALDRRAYRAPDLIKIQVLDTDQAGHASVGVTVRSMTESIGESVLLRASGNSGVFTGSIATATGPASADGKLQIANGDSIEARYLDASANLIRLGTARADFVAPVLSGVSASNSFGQVLIAWSSDEPANSIVRYGTNASLGAMTQAITNTTLATTHSISLARLIAGATYYFYVAALDEAGNGATNNNNGAFFPIVAAGVSPLLIIDEYGVDPLSGTTPPLSGYTDPLNQIGIHFDVWDVSTRGQPALNTLSPYRAVIWRPPEDFSTTWSLAERTGISNYLNSGGSLLVASMEVLSRLEEAGATDFIHNVLHVQSYVPDPQSSGANEIIGSQLDPLTSGLDIMMDYIVYDDMWGGALGPDLSDTLTPGTGASSILHNDVGDVVGIRWPGLGQQAPGRLVFFSFPLDAVPMSSGANDRINLLRNVIDFLAPGAPGSSTLTLDSSAYKLPSTATIQVGDAAAAGRGSVSITAKSSTQSAAISVALAETSTPGLFSGVLNIIAATNPPITGKLRAANGDSIVIQYVNVATSNSMEVSAVVDTVSPTISSVGAEPDYVSATIFWDTSELTDGLVQFGQSAFLDRTAYSGDLASSHDLTLPFLQPDQTYYYQVVSRDAAGNPQVDDNHGALYTFRTLRPILPPWFDNLDTGATNWITFTDPSLGGADWSLGVPHNSLTNSAHSPPAAWGSNLNGDTIDIAESYLISPAIYLTNGNLATLRFWHDYDFSDLSGFDIEYGEVDVIDANTGASTALAQFSDISGDWIEEELDLTPYAGKVVYLIWSYVLFSFDPAPRPGWLVDDVSVTVSNVQPGMVRITNNLWQASYIISGATFLKGKGVSATMTNAPPGQYIVEFADVPYYLAPPAQSNTLAPGGTIVFSGNYTFPDVNHNGISDLWEQAFFGSVSLNRSQQTDSDGDGMTDYAEFIAGTDPNSPISRPRLKATLTNAGVCRLQWPSAAGEQFRVHSSSDLITWVPFSAWLQATGAVSSIDISLSSIGPRAFFRLECGSPTNSPKGLAPNLRFSARRLTSGQWQLDWASSRYRGYQVQGSTDALNWTPLSPWFQATSSTSSYVVPAPAPGAPFLFRLQVQP